MLKSGKRFFNGVGIRFCLCFETASAHELEVECGLKD